MTITKNLEEEPQHRTSFSVSLFYKQFAQKICTGQSNNGYGYAERTCYFMKSDASAVPETMQDTYRVSGMQSCLSWNLMSEKDGSRNSSSKRDIHSGRIPARQSILLSFEYLYIGGSPIGQYCSFLGQGLSSQLILSENASQLILSESAITEQSKHVCLQ